MRLSERDIWSVKIPGTVGQARRLSWGCTRLRHVATGANPLFGVAPFRLLVMHYSTSDLERARGLVATDMAPDDTA